MVLISTAIFLTNTVATAGDLTTLERIQISSNRNLLSANKVGSAKTDFILAEDQLGLDRSVADRLIQVPGVSLNGQGGLLQSYSLRGLSRSRIRTEVDGIAIITDRRAGNSVSFIPPALIDAISVQKGPSSTIYGSEAMGGVVSLSTITPKNLNISYNRQNNDAQNGFAMSYGQKGLQGGLVVRKSDNSFAANNKELNTQFSQKAGLIKYQNKLADYDVVLSFLASDTENIGKSSALYPDERVTIYPSEKHSLSQFQMSYQQDWLVKFYHHYQNWDSDVHRVNKRTNLTAYQSHTLGSLFYKSQKLLKGEGRFGVEWIGRRGVNISETELDLEQNVNFSHSLLAAKQDNLGVFIDNHWQHQSLSFMLAMRFDTIYQDNINKAIARHDERLNTSFSATWDVSDTIEIHGEYGTGFRFPTLSELYFNGETPRGSTLGNPELAPETSEGISLDWSYQNDIGILALSGYVQVLDNYIQRYRVNEDLRSYQNLSEAKISGVELSYAVELGDWSHQMSYQWQKGTDSDNQTLADLNPVQWHFRSAWLFDNMSLNNHFSLREKKSDFGDGETQLNDVFIWNMKWLWQANENLTFTVNGNNLLNKLYFGSADEDADYQPGRTIGVAIDYTL